MGTYKKNIFVILVWLTAIFSISPSFAKMNFSSKEIIGWYDGMELPTPSEAIELQQKALSHSVDLDGILKRLPEDDLGAWRKLFGLSINFSQFDRLAQIYGYRLFVAFSYFIDSEGEAPFAELINSQTPQIRQRVRDFLYYEAANSDMHVMRNNEAILRGKLRLIFPSDYSFSANDTLFRSTSLKHSDHICRGGANRCGRRSIVETGATASKARRRAAA